MYLRALDVDKTNDEPRSRRLDTKFIFNERIDRVWNIIKDLTQYGKYYPNFTDSGKLVKGRKSYEVGGETSILWVGMTRLRFICNGGLEKEDYKFVNWHIDFAGKFYYDSTYKLFRNTAENSTLFDWKLDFNLDEDTKLLMLDVLDASNIARFNCVANTKEVLSHNLDQLDQTESIIIANSQQCIWDIVTDLQKLSLASPGFADKVDYKNKNAKLSYDNFIKLTYEKKNMVTYLSVIGQDQNPNIYVFRLKIIESQPKVPSQEIVFRLVKITTGSTFVCFTHEFNEHLPVNVIESMSPEKIKILNDLKSYCEK